MQLVINIVRLLVAGYRLGILAIGPMGIAFKVKGVGQQGCLLVGLGKGKALLQDGVDFGVTALLPQYLGLGQQAVSTQCGFVGGNESLGGVDDLQSLGVLPLVAQTAGDVDEQVGDEHGRVFCPRPLQLLHGRHQHRIRLLPQPQMVVERGQGRHTFA